jgi:hypothetical protein
MSSIFAAPKAWSTPGADAQGLDATAPQRGKTLKKLHQSMRPAQHNSMAAVAM